MRIAIYGTGGVGGYFGGVLARAGEEVILISRGKHLHAIQENGLKVDSIKGDFQVKPALATNDPAQAGPVEAVLVCVKAWQVPEIAAALPPLLGPETIVVPLGNGVDAPAQLKAVLDQPGQASHVLGGLCQISSYIVEPGHIRHAGIEPFVAFGPLDNKPRPMVERLRQAFAGAGVKVDVPADIQAAMWNKFIFISAISGVGAVTRAPAGTLRSIPETRRILEAAIRETVAVARASQVSLPEDEAERVLAFIDSLPVGTAASMQRDIMEGRPSELEAQNGAVVRMGLELGVPTPAHAFIFGSLLPLERKARGQAQF